MHLIHRVHTGHAFVACCNTWIYNSLTLQIDGPGMIVRLGQRLSCAGNMEQEDGCCCRAQLSTQHWTVDICQWPAALHHDMRLCYLML